MQCPRCGSTHIRKNGNKKRKQNNICVDCRRQFIDDYDPPQGYCDDMKRECIQMYLNGMGFRGIEREIAGGIIPPATLLRVKGVHHTTIIYWVKQLGEQLPDAPEEDEIPEVGELDEARNVCWVKKNKIWQWISGKSFRSRHSCLGIRRSQCQNV